MAESVNQQIADALTERQLQAGRVETDLRHQAWAILALLESEILAALKANDPTEFALLSRRRREVETLMREEIDPLIVARYERLARLMDEAMGRLAVNEAGAVERIVNSTAPGEPIEETPADATLKRRVAGALFPTPSRPTDLSASGADWWTRQGVSLSQRLGDSLLVGVSLEESLTQLAQRLRGTAEAAFTDGIMSRARSDAARLLGTQTTNALNEARVATADRNPGQDLIMIHQSTIDSRTSDLCLARHGLQYTIPDHEPINHSIPYLGGPPYHAHCRSIMTIGIRGQGTVMQESVTAWLRRRDRAFQDEVLGPTRAQMWRAGKLTIRQLIDSMTGRPLTLEELGA